VPQDPQFPVSLCVSTQAPLHATRGAVHPLDPSLPPAQVPELQTWFAPQAVPHAPQWAGSWDVRTHVPLQSVKPASHTQPLAPLQSIPPLQEVLHAPQWAGSLLKSTQLVPHRFKPVVHDVAQTPRSQTSVD
jgi:hypothetical protein